MLEVVNESRVEQLKALRDVIAEAIDDKPGARDLASLVKQYKEVIKEIEDIEQGMPGEDAIGDIIAERRYKGLPGSVRPSRIG